MRSPREFVRWWLDENKRAWREGWAEADQAKIRHLKAKARYLEARSRLREAEAAGARRSR